MTDADGVVSVATDPISFNAIGFYQPLSCPAPGQCALSSEDGERITFTGANRLGRIHAPRRSRRGRTSRAA